MCPWLWGFHPLLVVARWVRGFSRHVYRTSVVTEQYRLFTSGMHTLRWLYTLQELESTRRVTINYVANAKWDKKSEPIYLHPTAQQSNARQSPIRYTNDYSIIMHYWYSVRLLLFCCMSTTILLHIYDHSTALLRAFYMVVAMTLYDVSTPSITVIYSNDCITMIYWLLLNVLITTLITCLATIIL